MGLAAYGRPTMTDAVRKLIRRTPDGAFALDMDYFEYQTTAARSYSPRFVELFGRRAIRTSRSTSRPPKAGASPIAPPASSACSRTRWWTSRARCIGKPGLPDLCLGGGVALNGVANARILAESGFERVFVPSAPGDAGCALGRGALCRSHLFRQPGPRRARSSVLGADRRRSGAGAGGARGRPDRRRARRRGARSSGSPTSSPPAASSAGWTAPPSSARARSAIAAFWPRRTRARCATGSIATSSTARSSGRSRR